MKDQPPGVPEAMARLARARGKRFALHLSEDAREDAARAAALRPDFVVHCVKATRGDVRALADADVPIVLCPRSNARFGPLPDVATMREEGATLALGSDNAMLQSLDVLEDARFLVQRGLLPTEAALDAAIVGGARVARGRAEAPPPPRSWLRVGDAARFVVLPSHDALLQTKG
jgi:cytosine/adenosine deaminase-related metal-dependent hydrolase